jgi:hypothetical protein
MLRNYANSSDMVLYKQKCNKTVMQLLWIKAQPALYHKVQVKPLFECDGYMNLLSSEGRPRWCSG